MKEYSYHYLYKVTDEVTGEFYFGKRSCNCLPEEDVGYLGSGIWIKEHGTNGLKKEVVSLHPTRKEIGWKENELIRKYKDDELCRNRCYGKWCLTAYGAKMYVPRDAVEIEHIEGDYSVLEKLQMRVAQLKEKQNG